MRIFTFLFFTSTAFAQEPQELFWSSMCEVMGEDFYELALDRQNGESLARSTRKSRVFIDTIVPRTMDMFEQDTGFDVSKDLNDFYRTEEWRETGKKYLEGMYSRTLAWVYERYERPKLGEYRKEEARYVRDNVFMECMKIWDLGKAEKED